MKLAILFAVIIFLVCTASAAEQSSGYLVDSKCYKIAIGNVNPRSTSTTDLDMDRVIKLCVPTSKTTLFGLVQADWRMVILDSAGSSKAAEEIRAAGKQPSYVATVTGEIGGGIMAVESISLAQPR